ncbi:uncharacterized protein [Dermacentor andersoni]|uniref:uncharacterized protein n=1 Tax=Dermacentor andersoni TaxID=34620 RepID=UPI003B3A379D
MPPVSKHRHPRHGRRRTTWYRSAAHLFPLFSCAPAMVHAWVVTVADIASEARTVLRCHRPFAAWLRWTGWLSDAPLWQTCLVTAPFLLSLVMARYCCGGRRHEGAMVSSVRPRFSQSAIDHGENLVAASGTALGGTGRGAEHKSSDGHSQEAALTLATVLGISNQATTSYLLSGNQLDKSCASGGSGYRNSEREAAAVVIQRWIRTEFRRWLLDAAARRSLERRIHEGSGNALPRPAALLSLSFADPAPLCPEFSDLLMDGRTDGCYSVPF